MRRCGVRSRGVERYARLCRSSTQLRVWRRLTIELPVLWQDEYLVAVHKPAGAEHLSLDSTAVLAYTVKAVQELKAENESLKAEIDRLKSAR